MCTEFIIEKLIRFNISKSSSLRQQKSILRITRLLRNTFSNSQTLQKVKTHFLLPVLLLHFYFSQVKLNNL